MPKYITILGLVLAVTVGVVFWPRMFSPESEDVFSWRQVAKEVKTIKINGLELNNDGGVWKIGQVLADKKQVEQFLTKVSDSVTESIVAKKEASYDSYQVGKQGLEFELDTLKLVVGNNNPGGSGFYVRKADSKEVYLIRGQWRNELTKSENDWKDKIVIDIERNLITRVEIGGNKTKVFSSPQTEKVAEIFNPLIGEEIKLADEIKSDLQLTATLKSADNTELGTVVFRKQGEEWWAGRPDSKEVFKILAYKLNPLFSWISDKGI